MLLLTVSGCWVPEALARTGAPVTWPCGPVTYTIQGDATFVTTVRQVVGQVSAITGRPFVEVPDGQIQVRLYWPINGGSSGGWTKVKNDGNQFTNAIVNINPSASGAWSVLRLGIIRHEMGHAMGLAHTDEFDSIMYGQYMHVFDYRPVDIDGLQYLSSHCA